MSMLLVVTHRLWSIIGDSGSVVSSVGPSALALLSFHALTGNLGSRPPQLATSYLEDFRAPGGHGGLEERAGTDQGPRAHLLDAECGRELTPGEATQVDRGQGRHIAAQIRRVAGAVGPVVADAPAARVPGTERVGELHDNVPGCCVGAGRERRLHIYEAQPQAIADGEAELPRLRREQEQRVVDRQWPGAQ